jgi:DNA-binding NarL/FixJ family response regulator
MIVLIAEEHDVLRSALCGWFRTAFPGWQLVEARNGGEASDLARAHQLDIALVSMTLPPTNGLMITRHVKTSTPQTQVIVTTMHTGSRHQAAVAAAGATACVLKYRLADELEAVLDSLPGDGCAASNG